MPYIPVPNCVRVELVQNWNAQVVQNVLHYVKASPWDLAHMNELAEVVKNAWNTNIRGQLSDQLSLTLIRITDLSSETAEVVNYATGLPLIGGQASPSLPNNVACVFTKRTALRGRSYRGRIYQPGLTEGSVTGNTIVSPTSTNLRSGWAAMMGLNLPVTADDALMVVVSYQNNNAPRTEGVASLVTSITSDFTVDSQRRRLPGRGN